MAIQLDTTVPSANACDVRIERIADRTVVSFAADPRDSPVCLWFRFRLVNTNGTERSPVRLILRHQANMLGGGRPERIRPVMLYAQGDWQRMPAGEPEPLPDGRVDAGWTIVSPESFVDIAVCYPYDMDHVEQLVRDTAGRLHQDTIGVSQGGRPIIRLANGYGETDSTRPGIFCVARQHSGETPGSWALDGFLRAIADQGDDAPLVWAVPLSNIDGIVRGDYGKDNFPWDLNRAWGKPHMRHEIQVIQQDITRWRQRCRPAMLIDFHAPGLTHTGGVFTFVDAESVANPDPRLLTIRDHLGEFADPTFIRNGSYPTRWPRNSFCRHVIHDLDLFGATIEFPYALVGDRVLERDDYRTIGARLAAFTNTLR